MAATPQKGFVKVRGASGLTREVQIYVSDVAGATLRFDSGAGASANSAQYYSFPEDCVIEDIAIATGTADTTAFLVTVNNAPTGNTITYAAHLLTTNNRPGLAIRISRGALLSGVQLA